jgi:hypothetical protein
MFPPAIPELHKMLFRGVVPLELGIGGFLQSLDELVAYLDKHNIEITKCTKMCRQK